MTRSRFSVRLLATSGAALAFAFAGSASVASAAPRTTPSADKIALKIATATPHIYRVDAASGGVPSWTKTVTIQERVAGTSAWHAYTTSPVTKTHYKASLEFGFNNYQVRAVANAIGKHKAIATKPVTIKPTYVAFVSGTLTGLVSTPAVAAGDAVGVSYGYSCPPGTAAHAFGLSDLIGGEATDVVDDGSTGATGSGSGILESDGQLFGIEAIGLNTCTWHVEIDY